MNLRGDVLYKKGKELLTVTLTGLDLENTLKTRVLPYKSIEDILKFLWVVSEDKLPEWMNKVSVILPTTCYCYPHLQTLQPERTLVSKLSAPKTMVCHDYKGNYLDDAFINFQWDDASDVYNFTHWNVIDSFVYFSHELVTVPPPCWINIGHAHGVQVLGTLITEGKQGKAVWDRILCSQDYWEWFADCLSLINEAHKFDGYLLNVENCLDQGQIPKLLQFLKYLRKKLPTTSLIIWYDSVTNEGNLAWQNALNARNIDFFNVCDGIYLNYNYQLWQLEKSGLMAGSRKQDVYVGIDVFGRGCPGSGFFSSEAAAMARLYDLSLAIFAPGWTKEKCLILTEMTVPVAAVDRLFWRSLAKFLYCHGTGDQRRAKAVVGSRYKPENEDSDDPLQWINDQFQFILAPMPPCTDYKHEHEALLELQEGVVSFDEFRTDWFEKIPRPVLQLDDSQVNNSKRLVIDTNGQMGESTIPILFLEDLIQNEVRIEFWLNLTHKIHAKFPILPEGYIVVRDLNNSMETFRFKLDKLNFHSDGRMGSDSAIMQMLPTYYQHFTFSKEVKGTLMEVGFKAQPGIQFNIQKAVITPL